MEGCEARTVYGTSCRLCTPHSCSSKPNRTCTGRACRFRRRHRLSLPLQARLQWRPLLSQPVGGQQRLHSAPLLLAKATVGSEAGGSMGHAAKRQSAAKLCCGGGVHTMGVLRSCLWAMCLGWLRKVQCGPRAYLVHLGAQSIVIVRLAVHGAPVASNDCQQREQHHEWPDSAGWHMSARHRRCASSDEDPMLCDCGPIVYVCGAGGGRGEARGGYRGARSAGIQKL